MRREVILDATHPYFTIELTFTPSSIIVLNNTDQSVYLTIGSTGAPSAAFFDREILPTVAGIPANIALPNNSYQFAGYLPTPSDTTKNVVIIFQGTSDPYSNRLPAPFSAIRGGIGGAINLALDLGGKLIGGGRLRNFREYRLNALNPSQVVDLAFLSDTVFVLNNTDATLYMAPGGTMFPSASYNDLGIPQKSYAILEPQGGTQYGLYLDNPTEKDCFVIFAYGYADEYQMLKNWAWDWKTLLMKPIFFFQFAQVQPDFTFTILDNTVTAPTASFTTADLGSGAIQFTDTSTPPGGETIVAWFWDFGDGSVNPPEANQQNPIHVYQHSGIFSAILYVAASNGGVDFVEPGLPGTVLIYQSFSVTFDLTTSLESEGITITPLTDGAINSNSSWIPGTGLFADGVDPTFPNSVYLLFQIDGLLDYIQARNGGFGTHYGLVYFGELNATPSITNSVSVKGSISSPKADYVLRWGINAVYWDGVLQVGDTATGDTDFTANAFALELVKMTETGHGLDSGTAVISWSQKWLCFFYSPTSAPLTDASITIRSMILQGRYII